MQNYIQVIILSLVISFGLQAAKSPEGLSRAERMEFVEFVGAFQGFGYAFVGHLAGKILGEYGGYLGLGAGAYYAFNSIQKTSFRSRWQWTGRLRSWKAAGFRKEYAKNLAIIPAFFAWATGLPFLGMVVSAALGQEVLPHIIDWG